jgi:hypothetical protein
MTGRVYMITGTLEHLNTETLKHWNTGKMKITLLHRGYPLAGIKSIPPFDEGE